MKSVKKEIQLDFRIWEKIASGIQISDRYQFFKMVNLDGIWEMRGHIKESLE